MNTWAEVALPELAERFTIPTLSLYNTASQKIEELVRKNTYRLYVCGITPYDATHLGHAATYLTFDLINRFLTVQGARVLFVQNITDIDDPLLERAHRDGVAWEMLAHSQIELFKSDMAALHVIPPSHYIGVVEAMPLVSKAISKLNEKDATYFVDSDLYFRVRKDPEFGQRSHLDNEDMLAIFSERGGDPSRAGKEDPLDALVWLSHREGEPSWPSNFGDGRPGWHVECCAIALHYLQPDINDEYSIDIQGGGSDLIFPHHEMSASQSRILTGKPFARTYVHAGMIGLDGEKMSKSRGNLVFVSELVANGVNPMAIRWALMGHNYREDLMWTSQILTSAENEIAQLQKLLSKIDVAPTDGVIKGMIKALANNLDTPEVLALVREWMNESENGGTGGNAGELSRALDTLLGVAL